MNVIIIVIVILIVLCMFSKATIEIRDIEGKKIKIKIYLKVLKFIKIPINIKIRKKIKLKVLKVLQVLRDNREKLKIEKINIKAEFGTTDAVFVAYLYGFISTVIPFLLHDCKLPKKEKSQIDIRPYFDRNILKISINCIFSIKIVHIIYIIYVLKRRV